MKIRKWLAIPTSIIVTVSLAVAGFSLVAVAIMLHAVHVFTQETKVAEVIMSPIQEDENGEYIEIEFTPYLMPDALSATLNQGDSDVARIGQRQMYRIYGDTVAVRGPFLKLHDGLLLLNFENVYKLALIEGEYRRPANREQGEGTEVYLDGGFDESWWFTNNQEAVFPYNLVIDRFTFSGDEEPGFYGTGQKRYAIVVTRDTLTWNLEGIIE